MKDTRQNVLNNRNISKVRQEFWEEDESLAEGKSQEIEKPILLNVLHIERLQTISLTGK